MVAKNQSVEKRWGAAEDHCYSLGGGLKQRKELVLLGVLTLPPLEEAIGVMVLNNGMLSRKVTARFCFNLIVTAVVCIRQG